jgi:hypothetical protein
MNGKKICKSLREIRCRIAQANDIDFMPHVCTHEGDCAGTCPACESELRYIERQLLRRTALGKKVALAGLALGAASLMPMHAQQVATTTPQATTQRTTPRLVDAAPGDTTAVVVRGKVICEDDTCEAIGAHVILKGTKLGTGTDIDGNFAIRVPKGSKLVISYIGYETQEYEVKATTANEGVVIALKLKDDLKEEIVIVGGIQISPKMHAVDADIYLPDSPRR